jgi:hypothetical protein
MKVSIEELEPGDEIIISSFSDLKYMKVLVKPELSKTKKGWRTGKPLFKSVKCAICRKVHTNPDTGYKWSGYDFDTEDLNTIIYKDLEGRDMWLAKKGVKL